MFGIILLRDSLTKQHSSISAVLYVGALPILFIYTFLAATAIPRFEDALYHGSLMGMISSPLSHPKPSSNPMLNTLLPIRLVSGSQKVALEISSKFLKSKDILVISFTELNSWKRC